MDGKAELPKGPIQSIKTDLDCPDYCWVESRESVTLRIDR